MASRFDKRIARIVEENEKGTGEPAASSRDSEATASDDLEGVSLRPVPIQELHSGELLVLDENELQLDDPLGATMESGVIATQRRSKPRSGRGRVALWLALLLAVAGGVGYLWYSGLIPPLGPWLESLM